MFKQLFTRFSVTALLAAAVVLTACNTATELRVGAAEDSAAKQLSKGQVLVVSLESNPSTGYSWQVAQVDQAVLKQLGDPKFETPASSSGVVGAPGTEVFRFEAAGQGQTTLKLEYRRPWETGVAPIKTFTLQVTAK